MLLSAARFAWQTAAAVAIPASPGGVVLPAVTVPATTDDTSSSDSSSDSADSSDVDAGPVVVAVAPAVAVALEPAPEVEVRIVRLKLEAEVWHRILSFLVRGDFPDLPSVGRTRKDSHHRNRPG